MSSKSYNDKILAKFDVILASSSPRRFEIVHDIMGLHSLTVMKPSFEEDLDKTQFANNAIGYVCATSLEKAESIIRDLQAVSADEKSTATKDKLIICADTIVIGQDQTIYEKPQTKENQLKYLQSFCYNCDHIQVATSVNIIVWHPTTQKHEMTSFYETTDLYFDEEIPPDAIKQFVDTESALQVAGGFKIQEFSGAFIKKIDGDYYNVVGLPLNKTYKTILKLL